MSQRAMASAFLLAAAFSSAAIAAGVGVPPALHGEYTPGKLGLAQVAGGSGSLSLMPASQGCGWMPIYGDTSGQNYEYPEANATYWQASTPLVNAAGTSVAIQGQFPNARFFSISLYNGNWQLISALNDSDIQTASGQKPFLGPTQPNPAVPYGQAYSAAISFSAAAAVPAPNTLYVAPQISGASTLPSVQKLYLLYRVYEPYGATASGDVPLPQLSINGTPFSTVTQSALCQDLSSIAAQNATYSIPLSPGATALSAPANPAFTVYKDSGIPGLDVGVNGANQYMSASATLPAGYVYIVRGLAPSFPGEKGLKSGSVPDVRYWSVCQNTTPSTEVAACVGDFQAQLDANGYYHVVVSTSAPAGADTAHGFNWMPFGPQSPATVIYRQLLAEPGFSGAIGSAVMGEFTPQVVYCTTTAFQTLAATYPTRPDLVYQGCGGTP